MSRAFRADALDPAAASPCQPHSTEPRYLAGDSDRTPLADCVPVTEYHWTHWRNSLGEEFACSPSGQIRLARLTTPYTDYPWQIVSHWDPFAPARPDWTAYFSWGTPRELLNDWLGALAATHSGDERLDPLLAQALPSQFALAPLAEAGWQHDSRPECTSYTSPDGLATVLLEGNTADPEQEDPFGWSISVTHGESSWDARLGRRTPPLLIRAAVQALASTEPALRHRHELPGDLGPRLCAARAVPGTVSDPGTSTPPHLRINQPDPTNAPAPSRRR